MNNPFTQDHTLHDSVNEFLQEHFGKEDQQMNQDGAENESKNPGVFREDSEIYSVRNREEEDRFQ
jgi:hypothetical protein